ncbi:MAG: anthranilate phosphoribosyltransferase [Bacteroidetes bacterium]|nr:anthranilate phosphoribosyltransferase [Rhodothermia bacterium]MCS7155035.1 anthranilate phosphoribosyltransferase [Bacteroidota bacterium]MCX7907319.1 anthranilate phosphoribosyltransferase [Bacteroidota bacterium]MDW8137954.1 anthranilate phosphoribosyltransferase [Bacteroidota bacterium]MDW8286194.1 anthranilate phosphoribosyltransferase [Bacteroidota bacterium]
MNPVSPLRLALGRLAEGQSLGRELARAALQQIIEGQGTELETAALLLGLRARGETLEELVAFVEVMRQAAVPIPFEHPQLVDVCGTGGDNAETRNISTAVAFVVAGAGVPVAKHGNRGVSSRSGSADVLEALGVPIELEPEEASWALQEHGMAFLFAPRYHPAMRQVAPVRRALGVRTCFNLMGPLLNPAPVRRQLIGAFSHEAAQQILEVAVLLGWEHILVVHSDEGWDELSVCAPTTVYEYRSGQGKRIYRISPEDLGLERSAPEALRGGSPQENARALAALLEGEPGPYRDAVLLNAAFALYASGAAEDPTRGLELARDSLESGRAWAVLEALRRIREKSV